MRHFVTVTLNPAIDETVMLAQLRPGQVHRASAVSFYAGGKGVNVAGCLADWGAKVVASGIIGRGNAPVFEAFFAAKGIEDRFMRVAGETRTNIKLSHDGDTTDINLPGLLISAEESKRIFEIVVALGGKDTLVLLGGSLPEGIESGFYARLIAPLRAQGARVVLDTSGAALSQVLEGDALPFCIKPNRAELEAYVGHALADGAALIGVARGLIARGLELVVVSLGAEGALFVTADAALRAALPPLRVASTVGAGDAMVAGILAALDEGAELEGIARLATAFAAGKLQQGGANLPERRIVEALCADVQVRN
jgi:1-phosphofructokinase